MPQADVVRCQITARDVDRADATLLRAVRPKLRHFIEQRHPDLDPGGYLANQALDDERVEYVRDLLESEFGDLTRLEEAVIHSFGEQDLLTQRLAAAAKEARTVGERLADRITSFGGSWTFILSFFGFLLAWIAVNAWVLTTRPFDPYPFILLNLLLSCLAALQAPVIMMSQKRQEARDRERAEHDYQINLKAELEVRHLNEKMDHLLRHNVERLLEIQEVQMELLRELTETRRRPAG